MNIAVYLRVSTDEQTTDPQKRDLERYCELKGYVPTFYEDTGFSGSKTSRPALDQLLNAVRKGEHKAVLVWKFDRFARSTNFLIQTLEEFDARGVQFISFQENIDTNTSMGRAMFSIIAAMAQLERDIIRERVVAGIKAAQARGVHCGRKALDTSMIPVLRKQGLSQRAIASKLNMSVGLVNKVLKQQTA